VTAMQIGLSLFILIFTLLGISMYYMVKSSGKRYIIAGKSLPLFLVGSMLLAQSLDANATIGNATGTYLGGFWAGFQFPLGLALCLIVTGLFFAKPLNRMNLLTLPDFYFRRYNTTVEVIVSILMSFSFAILVAGNFAGSAWIISSIFPVDYPRALFIIAAIVFVYTVAGGLYSSAATDIVQIYPAMLGFWAAGFWLVYTYGWDYFAQSIPYHYLDLSGLVSIEHGALANWAGILALALGDVVALDFMERIFSARTPRIAQVSCFYGAGFTLVTGVVASFIGLMGLALFPEITEARDILPYIATMVVPFIFGLFIMGGIIGAGLSTADGGILGVSTVLGRNILQRNFLQWWAKRRAQNLQELQNIRPDMLISDRKLLIISRLMAVPVVAFAIYLAYVRPEPGILLVLAFDVVFAGCFVPLTLGIYWKKANGPGALTAVIVGSLLRLIGYLVTPEYWAGLDTLVPPVISLLVMVPVSLLTQAKYPPKHEMIEYVPSEEDVLSAVY
jgi:solute:Na+ symporter, SSS family